MDIALKESSLSTEKFSPTVQQAQHAMVEYIDLFSLTNTVQHLENSIKSDNP
jgi:hypothetical protein